jgi:hypothetical protein
MCEVSQLISIGDTVPPDSVLLLIFWFAASIFDSLRLQQDFEWGPSKQTKCEVVSLPVRNATRWSEASLFEHQIDWEVWRNVGHRNGTNETLLHRQSRSWWTIQNYLQNRGMWTCQLICHSRFQTKVYFSSSLTGRPWWNWNNDGNIVGGFDPLEFEFPRGKKEGGKDSCTTGWERVTICEQRSNGFFQYPRRVKFMQALPD